MPSLGNDLLQSMIGHTCYEFIPLTVATEGKFEGAYCFTDRYWLIVEDHILVYVGKRKDTYSPQCNSQERVLDSWTDKKDYFAGFRSRVELLPYVYVDGNRYLTGRV